MVDNVPNPGVTKKISTKSCTDWGGDDISCYFYLDYDHVRFHHLVVASATICGTIIVYMFIKWFRTYRENAFVRSLPRTVCISRQRMATKMYTMILEQSARALIPESAWLVAIPDGGLGDLGWGVPGSRLGNTHFKTSVRQSYLILQQEILDNRLLSSNLGISLENGTLVMDTEIQNNDDGLGVDYHLSGKNSSRVQSVQNYKGDDGGIIKCNRKIYKVKVHTVRHLFQILQSRVPSLGAEPELCASYIRIYQDARFSPASRTFTAAMYTGFLDIFCQIVDILQDVASNLSRLSKEDNNCLKQGLSNTFGFGLGLREHPNNNLIVDQTESSPLPVLSNPRTTRRNINIL